MTTNVARAHCAITLNLVEFNLFSASANCDDLKTEMNSLMKQTLCLQSYLKLET